LAGDITSVSVASVVIAGVLGASAVDVCDTVDGAGGGVLILSEIAEGTGECRGKEAADGVNGVDGVNGAACTGSCA
jgi:hypothetical protein